ncbi:MAG: DUF2288 domain-containing protein [Gammaproteobacteria bacterium]|nr:DUF2288 domain-containing protein [Gammaproteobacteria bacterium]
MEHELPLRARLNAETARLAWRELETFFARGVVIRVAAELDLVEAAARIVEDDKAAIEAWLLAGQIGKPDADQARDWHARGAQLWAVVAAPWVLVQERP